MVHHGWETCRFGVGDFGIPGGEENFADGLEFHSIVVMAEPNQREVRTSGAISACMHFDDFVLRIFCGCFEGRLDFFAGVDVICAVLENWIGSPAREV